jgi:hypothetical protein
MESDFDPTASDENDGFVDDEISGGEEVCVKDLMSLLRFENIPT